MPKPQKKGKGPRGQKDRQSFDESALEQLTSKIGQNLNSNTNKRKHPPTNAGGKEQQKRRRNFEDSRPSKNQIPDDQAALLAEIRALGGDEKDLELINGVDSDDETYGKESGGAVDKDLKDELLALSKELGFADIDPEVMIAADEQPYEVNDDEDEEEGEDSDHEGEDDDADDMETEVIKRIRKPGDMVGRRLYQWDIFSNVNYYTRSSSRELIGTPTNLRSCPSRLSTSWARLLERLKLSKHMPKRFWKATVTSTRLACLLRRLISSCLQSCLQVP